MTVFAFQTINNFPAGSNLVAGHSPLPAYLSIATQPPVANPSDVWRYAAYLPPKPTVVLEGVGFTPLQRADRLARALGLSELYLKNEATNPTGSFADRVASFAVQEALESGYTSLACAANGSLVESLAAAGARAGFKIHLFVPASAEPANLLAATFYGAQVISVKGSLADACHLAEAAASKFDWWLVNANLRNAYSNACKTLALETAEQLGWCFPDHVILPVVSGAVLHQLCLGFEEVIKAELVADKALPIISGVKIAGDSSVLQAFDSGLDDIAPCLPTSLTGLDKDGKKTEIDQGAALSRRTGGVLGQVSESEVIQAIRLLASTEGIFTEPAGGATLALLRKLVQQGQIRRDEVTVLYLTGSGHKANRAFQDWLPLPTPIAPDLSALEFYLELLTTV